MLYKNHIFQCIGKIFCVEFQRVPLKFHTKYLTHTLKYVEFIHRWKCKSSKIYELISVFAMPLSWSFVKWSRWLPSQGIFDVFFYVGLNNPLNKQSSYRWLETSSRSRDAHVILVMWCRRLKCRYFLLALSALEWTHYSDFICAPWRVISPAYQQFVQQLNFVYNKENFKAPYYFVRGIHRWPLYSLIKDQ